MKIAVSICGVRFLSVVLNVAVRVDPITVYFVS